MANTDVNSANNINNNMIESEPPKKTAIEAMEFQVSQVINRLEEAVIGKTSVCDISNSSAVVNNDDSGHDSRSSTVLQQLVDLLLHDSANESGFAALPELCEASRLSVLSHAIAAYAGSMERNHVTHLANKIVKDTSAWITELFNRDSLSVTYHDDQLGGLVRIIRSYLGMKFNRYRDQGFDAFKNTLPVIYTSAAASPGIVHYICKQLGLPLACISPITCNTLFGSQKMDLAALEREIELDKAKNRIPLVVLADAGTPILGHVDNIPRLREICATHGMWLHLRGHSIAALAIARTTENMSRFLESISLPLGIWLGIPGLPTATVFSDALVPHLADNPGRKLMPLPIWTTFQCMGLDEIRKRFRDAFESCHTLWKRIEKYPNIRLLSQSPGGEGGIVPISELASRTSIDTSVLFEVASSAVVFQFVPENVEGKVPPYFDKLNSWLGQMLQRDCPLVNITLCEADNGEVVLRYCPLEPQAGSHEPPDFDAFVACLEQQIDILTATVRHKAEFHRLAELSPCLRIVEIDGWAGLGGVRYQPAAFKDDQLTDHAKEQLNNLNVNLVERLRTTDAAFSQGEGGDGLACVRFGMVTGDTEVGELLSLVETAGQEEEESGKQLDNMAEVVKRGIEAATTEIKKESEEVYWQDGLLRQVPVFGTFVNWLSPKSNGVRGRSLDLNAGIVATTDMIYKYHMQSSPPQPTEQTTVGHSRSSSGSSNQLPQL